MCIKCNIIKCDDLIGGKNLYNCIVLVSKMKVSLWSENVRYA